MPSAINVENLSKKFDISKLKKETQFREALVNFARRALFRGQEKKEEIWALKDVSFSVEKGEIVGLIGRNGAGKSTLLKVLSKIMYPTSGQFRIEGRVGSLLEVGTGFHWELTGRENIYLNGSILGMKKKEVKEKLDAIIAFAEVDKFLDTPIKKYSSGMRLKLGFSVAAHLDTDVMFVDEVLAVGDVAFQKKCLDTMKDLRNNGKTMIFVSHTMSTVEALCPRVIWIDKGELRVDGPTTNIINDYMSSFSVEVNQTEYDLSLVQQRQGSGEIRYTRMEYLDRDGQPKKVIRSGDSLKVRLYFQVNKPVTNPDFRIRIYTVMGSQLTTLCTNLSGYATPILYPGNGHVDVDIEFLNIMPDRYYITLSIFNENEVITSNALSYDKLERCAVLDVEGSNYYHTGKGIDKWWGIMFLPYKWNFDGFNHKEEPVKTPIGSFQQLS